MYIMTTITTLKKVLFYLSKQKDGQAKSTISKAIGSQYSSVKLCIEFLATLKLVEEVMFHDRAFYTLNEPWKTTLEFKKKGHYIKIRSS